MLRALGVALAAGACGGITAVGSQDGIPTEAAVNRIESGQFRAAPEIAFEHRGTFGALNTNGRAINQRGDVVALYDRGHVAGIRVHASPSEPLGALTLGPNLKVAQESETAPFIKAGPKAGIPGMWVNSDVRSLHFSPDGRWLMINGGDDASLTLVDLERRVLAAEALRPEDTQVLALDDDQLILGSWKEGRLESWTLSPLAMANQIAVPHAARMGVRLGNGHIAIVADRIGESGVELSIWDIANQLAVATTTLPGSVSSLQAAGDDIILVRRPQSCLELECHLERWRYTAGALSRIWTFDLSVGSYDYLFDPAVTRGRYRISHNGRLTTWNIDLTTDSPSRVLAPDASRAVLALASQPGVLVVTRGSEDIEARPPLVVVGSEEIPLATLGWFGRPVTFDSKGRWMAAADGMGRVRVWRTSDWSPWVTIGQTSASHVFGWKLPYKVSGAPDLVRSWESRIKAAGYESGESVSLHFVGTRYSRTDPWSPIPKTRRDDGGPLFELTGIEIGYQASGALGLLPTFIARGEFENLPTWLQVQARAAGYGPQDLVEYYYDLTSGQGRILLKSKDTGFD
jgi:hypothetical protein